MPYFGRFPLFFVSITFLLQTAVAAEFFQLPEEKESALQYLYHSIESAENQIMMTAFGLSHRGIGKALKAAAKEGVRITILFDRNNNLDSAYSQIGYLAKYKNIRVYTVMGTGENKKGIMHTNTLVIDDKRAFLTSANWSFSGFQRNHEFLLMSEEKKIVDGLLKKADILIRSGEQY